MRGLPVVAPLALAAALAFTVGSGRAVTAPQPAFTVVEATIPEMQAALKDGRVTSRQLVLLHLARIAYYEDLLNAVITVSRTALDEADELDRERAAGHVRGPLHGIPVALKDNIHTTNMPTTGGALAFKGFTPPYEATLTKNLKDAGAIIIAKTVMTELANWVAGGPTPMPGNYSALGGFGMNPYDPRPDPRAGFDDGRPALFTGGSSSGIGTAASFWAANVGSETSGSILSPSNQNMLVGIKPTVGRISRYGVIPITADQDTAGPMARTVTDAAIMLGALESPSPDPHDPATTACTPPPNRDYTAFLKADGLKGARIGIPRAFFYDEVKAPGSDRPRGGLDKDRAAVMAEAIEILKKAGAIIVDPADIPSIVDPDPARNFVGWGICSGVDGRKGRDEGCSVVLKYGMKRDFNAWLATLGPGAPIKTLTDLRYFNLAHVREHAIKYGQSQLDISDEMDVAADKARYEADRRKDLELAGTHGIEEVMRAQRLDALLFPAANGASIAARPGYPTVIVPFGRAPNAPTPPFPRGFDAKPAPFGVSFTGLSCSEPRLIELAYAFEQATKRRVPPPSTP
jgi:amidase